MMRRILLILIEKYLKTLKPRTELSEYMQFISNQKSYEVIIIIDFMRSLKVQFKTANNARNGKIKFQFQLFCFCSSLVTHQSTQFFVHITKIATLFTKQFSFFLLKFFSRTAPNFFNFYIALRFYFVKVLATNFLYFETPAKKKKKLIVILFSTVGQCLFC